MFGIHKLIICCVLCSLVTGKNGSVDEENKKNKEKDEDLKLDPPPQNGMNGHEPQTNGVDDELKPENDQKPSNDSSKRKESASELGVLEETNEGIVSLDEVDLGLSDDNTTVKNTTKNNRQNSRVSRQSTTSVSSFQSATDELTENPVDNTTDNSRESISLDDGSTIDTNLSGYRRESNVSGSKADVLIVSKENELDETEPKSLDAMGENEAVQDNRAEGKSKRKRINTTSKSSSNKNKGQRKNCKVS